MILALLCRQANRSLARCLAEASRAEEEAWDRLQLLTDSLRTMRGCLGDSSRELQRQVGDRCLPVFLCWMTKQAALVASRTVRTEPSSASFLASFQAGTGLCRWGCRKCCLLCRSPDADSSPGADRHVISVDDSTAPPYNLYSEGRKACVGIS